MNGISNQNIGLAFTYSAAHLVPPENYLSAPLGRVAGPTARALAERDPQKKGVYVVTWEDVAYFGSQGYGLVDELERQGFDARATPTFHVPVTATRVIDQAQATLQVHFATGLYVDRWRARSDAIEVAFYDPRNDEQKQRYAAMRASVLSHLHDLGLDDLAAHLDSNLFGVQLDPRVPRSVNVIIDRMLQLGQPTAVFLAPATAI